MLVVKKYRDPEVSALTQKLLVWLIEEMGVVVYLEQSALEEEFPPLPSVCDDIEKIYENIRVWQPGPLPMTTGLSAREGQPANDHVEEDDAGKFFSFFFSKFTIVTGRLQDGNPLLSFFF